MQDADRALEAARQAGKDKTCPAEFKAAEDAKNNAYDVYRACHTEEGVALAKEATAKANALCPPQAVKEEPAPVVPSPAPPAPPVPSDNLTVTPSSVTKGQSATLAWSSQNATTCNIQPGIGQVQPQGSMTVTPAADTTYTLTCNGEGGTAKSTAYIDVAAPAPVAQPMTKLCSPTVINIKFDTNKADIKPQYHDELKKLADFLKEFPNAKGSIEGHTDSVGTMSGNMKLSQRRAESVRNYLIKNFGIAPERLGAKGFGPTKPVADNKTAAGKQQNRRIESNFTCE
ncbi:OmpA family protein [Geobacter sp. FeAm09]|uniref:OmpA family protein n=1 Tax=Geobacter sp. FeAm09 TaxID=2597769 RepID=UPI001F0E5483|nr:OmpA family protein [Geobacter sp. FeAm09]